MSYIDLLPIELRNIIASYYTVENNKSGSNIENYIKTLDILNIKDFKFLYYITFPEYHEVTLDELPYFSKSKYDIYLDLLIFIPKIMNNEDLYPYLYENYFNIIYRYKFKQQFPNLYKLMKNFNLLKGGILDVITYFYITEDSQKVEFSGWKGLSLQLNDDDLLNQSIKLVENGELPTDYKFEINNTLTFDFVMYLYSTIAFYPNFRFELQPIDIIYDLLLFSYWYNEDIYLKLRAMIPDGVYKNILNDPVIISEIEIIYGEGDERERDIPLIEYIKSRANQKSL